MPNHTPGPWKWNPRFEGGWYVSLGHAGTYMRPRGMSDEESLANAHLIAAAPDLLAACKAAEEFVRLIGRTVRPSPWRQLVAAINKAEQGADHA